MLNIVFKLKYKTYYHYYIIFSENYYHKFTNCKSYNIHITYYLKFVTADKQSKSYAASHTLL